VKRVTVVSACSGHGFKHSAALGEAIADKVAGDLAKVKLAPFALSRLVEPRSDMVESHGPRPIPPNPNGCSGQQR
jgi:glycine/D-amino acid oxidase-like deaminating enzyme